MSTPADAALTAPTQFRAELRADVTRGLSASPKQLPPRWLYDPLGSELFEQITQLPGVAAPPVSRTGRVASAMARGLRSCRAAVLHCVPFRNAS